MTTQLTNPLKEKQPQRLGRWTKESLEEYAEKLNKYNWVRASGKPYFVAKRLKDDNTIQHYLDRKI